LGIAFNLSLLQQRAQEIKMALGALARHQSKGKAQFLADEDGIAAAKYQFNYYVTKGRVLISRDEELRCNFVERTWLQYLDFEPYRKELLRDLFGAGESRSPDA